MSSTMKKHNLRSKKKSENDRGKEFACQQCDYVATKPLLLDWHTMTKHKDRSDTEENTNVVVKDDPDEKTPTKKGSKAPLLKMYSISPKKYTCTECTFRTATLNKFRKHIKAEHDQNKKWWA